MSRKGATTKRTITALVVAASLFGVVTAAQAAGSKSADRGREHGHHHGEELTKRQLAQLRQATAHNRRVANALADGFEPFAIPPEVGGTPTTGLGLPGDPTCFDSSTGGMGVHYVKGIDGDVSLTAPEAMVYSVGKHGKLTLVAVEYIVPDSLVDPAAPPSLLGHTFHHHSYLPVYILHIWAWKDNPDGMFEDFNPDVRPCPTPAI